MIDPISDFQAAMRSRGLIPPADFHSDGKLHRCAVEGKNGKGAGAYLLHLDGRPAGGFQNHKDGLGWENWVAEAERPLSNAEAERQRSRIEEDRRAREADDVARKEKAAKTARWLLERADPVSPDHAYLVRKGVNAHGIRESRGNLVVPVRDADGMLHSLQFIKPDGGKIFLTGGRKGGCFHLIGEVTDILVIVEGFATGATVFEATGLPTAIAFDSGNLLPVATALRSKYPKTKIIIGADDDWLAVRYVAGVAVRYNSGLSSAIEAARAVGGLTAVPIFGPDRGEKDTDFNDHAATAGPDAVRRDIEAAKSPDEIPVLVEQQQANSERTGDHPNGGAEPVAPETAPKPKPAQRAVGKRGSPFRLGKFGVEKKTDTPDGEEWRWFCSPLEIIAATRDSRGEEWGRLVKVTDMDGQCRTWALPMSLLAGDGSAYRERLLSMGLSIAPSKTARDALHEYLMTTRPEARLTCVSRIGWHGDVFVLPDRGFSLAGDTDTGEGTVLQTASFSDHAFNLAGDAETWRRSVAALAIGNSRLLLSLSAAFSAPLIRLLGLEGGGVHFRGLSSIGKSTITEVAGSVWGGGTKGYARTWRATDNALEAVAAMHCDALLVLDEIAAVNPAAAAASAYMLSAGVGKHRAARNGDARPTLEWKVLLLSTGEISLADKIAEDGKGSRAMAGQQARLIDLPADAGTGYGVFEALHGHENGDTLACALKAASASDYGHAAREFLTAITKDLAGVRETVAGIQKGFVSDHCPPGADGQVLRVASRFGLIAAAGELAASLGIVPWPEREATGGAARCFGDWISERGGVGAQEDTDAIRQVRKFVETYGTSRFERMYPPRDEDGTQEPSSERTLNRVGFRNVLKDYTEFYVLPESWRTEVCRGHDAKYVAKVLLERGMLTPDAAGKSTRLKRMPGFANPIRVYCLSQKLMDYSDGV